MDPVTLGAKREAVLETLRRARRVVVAFSGGVDSAVLLGLAVEALGPGAVLAVTGSSESLPHHDALDARKLTKSMGVEHLEVETGELDLPAYRANAGDRCYHCRSTLFSLLKKIATERGDRQVIYGAIVDDLGDVRPGMTAARDAAVLAPLLEAGLTKADVRAIAREMGLELEGKPASACLSSRIPIGTEVTRERLRQVGDAERALMDLGFLQVRVRHHGEIARLELDGSGIEALGSANLRARVAAAVRAAGFRYVTLDLEGYRQGSLNPIPPQRTGPNREGGQ